MLVMDLIRKGYWAGPTLLLAPAAVPGIDDLTLAPTAGIKIVFGGNDTRGLSAPAVCRNIAEANSSLRGSTITLLEVDDTYELSSLVAAEQSDQSLAALIRGMAATGKNNGSAGPFLPKEDEWTASQAKRHGSSAVPRGAGCCALS